MLRIEGVTAAYDDEVVLHDLDLAVPAGELLCVLGPSGGGKSTLLRVIAGLEEPRAGRLELDGRDLAGVPAHERGVGRCLQGVGESCFRLAVHLSQAAREHLAQAFFQTCLGEIGQRLACDGKHFLLCPAAECLMQGLLFNSQGCLPF